MTLIVGIGGSTRAGSSSEAALRRALVHAESAGAEVLIFAGPDIEFAIYAPERAHHDSRALEMIEALRRADGILIASPGYHGSISGMVKNALDYTEDMRGDVRSYFDGRAVGCIACAAGWQAAVHTLAVLRDIVHALRGWPTPMGVAINTADGTFRGDALPAALDAQLKLVAEQVVAFADQARAMAGHEVAAL